MVAPDNLLGNVHAIVTGLPIRRLRPRGQRFNLGGELRFEPLGSGRGHRRARGDGWRWWRLGMTQEQFAARFGVSVATLCYWERGDCVPHGPALMLLNLIDREPQAVMRAFG